MKSLEYVEGLCKKLRLVLGVQAEQLWYMYLTEDEKSRRETVEFIEILVEKHLKQNTPLEKPILLEPPSAQNSTGEFFLGNAIYNDKTLHNVNLTRSDFTKQVGVFAVTGEGKTNLAFLLALQLLQKQIPFLVLDWKRSWRNLLSLYEKYPELKKVKVFTVGRDILPFLWNPLRAPSGADQELWLSTVAESLERSHLSGPGVAYHFENIYTKLFKQLDDSFFPNFFDGLKEIQNKKVSYRELQWKQTALRIFQSFTVGNAAHVFNARNPLKLEALLDKPVILELDMELPKPLRVFFSEIILRWIHLYRLGQGESDSLRHVLFLEEVHNLFENTSWNKSHNNLENVYREIRGFGQGIVSITQHPSLLPIYLLGNCHTQVFMGLQHNDDIQTARKSLFLKKSEEAYLNQLSVGECILKVKNRIQPCYVRTPLVPIKKGKITDLWLKQNIYTDLPALHDDKTGAKEGYLPIDNNKTAPSKTGQTTSNISQATKFPAAQMLVDIFKYPLSNTSERYKRLKLNPKYGNRQKQKLIEDGYIKQVDIKTRTGKISLYEITTKGKLALQDLGEDVRQKNEGVVHLYWKTKIAEDYKKQGYKVDVEKYINGRADIIAEKDGKRTAIEIETGKSDILKNIKRNIEAGFDEIICVATDKDVERKIRGVVELERLSHQAILTCCTVLDSNFIE